MDISFRLTPRLLKNTQTLVRLYNTNLHFREQFEALLSRPNVTFQGQPLAAYAWVIYKISPRYYSRAKEVWGSQERIKDLLVEYYHDRRELNNLERKIDNLGKTDQISTPLSEGVLATAEQIEKTPEGDPKKVKLIEQIRQEIAEDLKTPPVEETPTSPALKPEIPPSTAQEPVGVKPETVVVEPAPIIPEKTIAETLPKTVKEPGKEPKKQVQTPAQPTSTPKPIAEPKIIPGKTIETVKGPEIIEGRGNKYPLKVAGGSEVATTTIPKPQVISALPKIKIPDLKEGARQKLSALKNLQAPYPLQNFAKNTFSFGKRLVIRNTPIIISSTIGGFVGGALMGPPGITAGLVGGGLFPSIIKSGVWQKGATASVAKGAGKLAVKGALGLSNPVGWAWLALSTPGVKTAVKYAMIAFLALFALPIIMNLNKSQSLFPPYDTAYSAPLPAGEPPGGSMGDINYLIPVRDTSVAPRDVKAQILRSWPNAKTEFWDSIIEWSKTNGWNPAFVLTLWVEESGAQHFQNADPIGCTLGEDISDPRQKLDASLSCLNKFISAHFAAGYSDTMFPKFMCIYSEGHYPCTFNRNNFPAAIKDWYSIIAGLNLIITPSPSPSPQPVPISGLALSCPLGNNIAITCGSINNPSSNGCAHGNPTRYQPCKSPPYASCPNGGHTDQLKAAIDVDLVGRNSANATVSLPLINNSSSQDWALVEGPVFISSDWGYKAVYRTLYNNQEIKIDLTHINPTVKTTAKSGAPVATVKPGVDGKTQSGTTYQHLHTAASIGNVWTEAINVSMCYK